MFFLFTEYDKLLQQLSKQCGELFTVGSSVKCASDLFVFLQQVCSVGMRIIHLNAMLINVLVQNINAFEFKSPRKLKCMQSVALNNQKSCLAALSASPLKIQSTAEGFKLYCTLKYYINNLKTTWHFK